MRIYTLGFLASLFSVMCFGQSPGNVSGNLRWWLKSNAGAYNTGTTPATNGQTVATWDDQSTISNDAVNGTAGTSPVYRTGIINGYPALEFDGTKFLDASALSGIGGTESFHIFMVFKLNSFQTDGGQLDGSGTFMMDRRDVTNNLTSFKIVNTNKYFYQRREDGDANLGGPEAATSVNTTSFVIADYYRRNNAGTFTEGIYLNGALDVSQAGPSGSITGPLLKIGRHATNPNGGINGYISEVALYNTELISTNSRQRIESYLAIKHGITLSPTLDYVRSDGTTIYPSTAASHSGYVTDIAGIGLDDGVTSSGLDQRSSASQNVGNMVSITTRLLGAIPNNGDFLIWGHNNGSITTPNSADVQSPVVRRLSRVWRVAETGEVGRVTISVDLSSVPGAKVAADLRLLIDANGVFNAGVNSISGTLAGNIFTITTSGNNILENGDYFTIGTVNATTTPLPIELAEFKVGYEAPQVAASWKTVSERNNDYFTLERAGEDLSFQEIAREPGAGTTNQPRSYSAVDPYPFEGKSYYRLKQTDLDGTSTYSAPRFIFIESSNKKISIFPNPSDGQHFNVRFGNARFQLSEVEVFNQQGLSVARSIVEEKNLVEYQIAWTKNLASGIYNVRIRYNGKEEYQKVFVH